MLKKRFIYPLFGQSKQTKFLGGMSILCSAIETFTGAFFTIRPNVPPFFHKNRLIDVK